MVNSSLSLGHKSHGVTLGQHSLLAQPTSQGCSVENRRREEFLKKGKKEKRKKGDRKEREGRERERERKELKEKKGREGRKEGKKEGRREKRKGRKEGDRKERKEGGREKGIKGREEGGRERNEIYERKEEGLDLIIFFFKKIPKLQKKPSKNACTRAHTHTHTLTDFLTTLKQGAIMSCIEHPGSRPITVVQEEKADNLVVRLTLLSNSAFLPPLFSPGSFQLDSGKPFSRLYVAHPWA
ncbi:Pxr1, partial [Ophiophagus hannah]